eukprot:gene25245-16942_t
MVEVTVPPNSPPGTALTVVSPSGQTIQAVIPPGV